MSQFVAIAALRVVTGFAQFAVILFLTGVLTLPDLGAYSLFVIFLGYGAQLAGFTFYTYVLRELAKYNSDEWPRLLFQQWGFLLASTTLASLVAFVGGLSGLLPVVNSSLFVLLLALTVFNTQHENFLIGAGYPVASAINLLLRTSWIYAVMAVWLAWPETIDLNAVLLAWACTEAFAAVFVLIFLRTKGLLPGRVYDIDISWIAKGASVGARYTMMAIFLLVTISVQRVVLGYTNGEEAVGIFHFFFVISVFGPNLLEASLFAVTLPRLISSYQGVADKQLSFPAGYSFAVLIGLGLLGLGLLYFILPFGLDLLNKSKLFEYRYLFVFTAIYALFYTTARIFHYSLYAAGKDSYLFRANAVSCVIAVGASWWLIPVGGITGAVWALVATGSALLISLAAPFFRRIAA